MMAAPCPPAILAKSENGADVFPANACRIALRVRKVDVLFRAVVAKVWAKATIREEAKGFLARRRAAPRRVLCFARNGGIGACLEAVKIDHRVEGRPVYNWQLALYQVALLLLLLFLVNHRVPLGVWHVAPGRGRLRSCQ
jgi:hypothetical protein